MVTEYLLDMQPGLYKVIAATASGSTDRFIHDPMGIAQHEDNSGDWHWMAKDGLGTVRGIYDDTLAEVYDADRDPYGDLLASTGSNPTPFEYTGEPEDPNGLLHLRARYYDLNLAVFNSRDPLETANRYAYVGGDPVNNIDPTGNAACSSGGSGSFDPVENLLSEFTPPGVMNITLQQRTCITPPVQHGGSDGPRNINRVEVKAKYFGITLTRQCLDTPAAEESWDGRISTVLSALLAIKQVGGLTVFDDTEIRIMHRNRPSGDVPAETFGPSIDGNDNYVIEIYPFGLGVYTPQLIVHELGHVLQNRESEVLRTATRYSRVDSLEPEAGTTVRGFWLPIDAVNIISADYVRGSYDRSDFNTEYLADSLVWWVYSNQVFPGGIPADLEKLGVFLNGGRLEESNDDGTTSIFYSDGMAAWVQ